MSQAFTAERAPSSEVPRGFRVKGASVGGIGDEEPVHIFTGDVDYAYPCRQRPQHVVMELAKRGIPIA